MAILADIHGNLPALEAVVADLRQSAPDVVYLAGDQVNRCPWNREVMALIETMGWPAIAGNHDLVVGRINTPENRPPFTERAHFPTLWWTQEQLTAEQLKTIRQWPLERRISFDGFPAIRLFHGIPETPFVGILPEDPAAQISELLQDVTESVILCGHTHRPLARTVDQWTIYNGGSVGIPYNSDPSAQYLLLDGIENAWQPTWRRVAYDHSPIPLAFESSGLQAASGPMAELHLRTIMNGEPWISDFGHWLYHQEDESRADMTKAVAAYLATHGPGHWSFDINLANG